MPTSDAVFARYPNAIFVESGSLVGDGIQAALNAGFSTVVSIELAPKYFEHCRARFVDRPEVILFNGDTEDVLPAILKQITVPATFWLDGHYSCGDTALGRHWAPLMQELDVIGSHDIKTHTILIDDMRCWQEPNPTHGFWKEDIFRKVREINSAYQFAYHDGIEPNDVLACVVK
jgi:hypothetical protein